MRELQASELQLISGGNDPQMTLPVVTTTGQHQPNFGMGWISGLGSDGLQFSDFDDALGVGPEDEREDDPCGSGYYPEDFPEGVSPEALGREAWEAINKILANVSSGQNQEGLIAIYQTANGLVSGTLLLGPVGGGQVPFNISTLVNPNLGTLVALVHNHPSGSVQPGPDDYNALNSLTAFASTGLVSPNLVLYVGVLTQVATPSGSIQGTSLYVFTDNAHNATGVQEGQRVNEDGSSGCRIS